MNDASTDCQADNFSCVNPGHVAHVDRVQRLVIGGTLMVLTLSSSIGAMNWRTWIALFLQADLLLTGLFGWCPVYWTCRRNRKQSTVS